MAGTMFGRSMLRRGDFLDFSTVFGGWGNPIKFGGGQETTAEQNLFVLAYQKRTSC
jgi:hypothetical protein